MTKEKTSIIKIESKENIEKCWDVIKLLRPQLTKEAFVSSVITMMREEKYRVIVLRDQDRFIAYAGYRVMTTLHSGKIFYLDDLCTDTSYRNKGLASILLNYIKNEAENLEKDAITLDSSYDLTNAHRLYLNHSFQIIAHHFMLTIDNNSLADKKRP